MDAPLPTLAPASHTWLELGEVQRLLLDAFPRVVLGLGFDGVVQWANPAAATRLGVGRGALGGRHFGGDLVDASALQQRAALLSEELGEPVAGDAGVLFAKLRRGLLSDEHEWPLRHEDGSLVPVRLAMGALRDHEGRAVGLVAVEAPREGDEAPLHFTHHDTLTGLPNRAVLTDRAEVALQRAARQHSVVAFLLIDIAGFDALCETRGHGVGGDVLRATASRLHFELRKTDTAVRLDRGQFVAMLVDLHHADEVKAVAAKVRQALSARINVGVALLNPEIRIGAAWSPDHGDQLLPLLGAAESALAAVPPEGGVAFAPAPQA